MNKSQAINQLKELLKERCLSKDDEVRVYGQDYSYHVDGKPDAVVFPRNENEVIQIVKICEKFAVPIIPYGSGTSLEGHITPVRGGICLSFKEMAELISVHPTDLDVIVQPGLSFVKLNTLLESHGLYFPLDAGPNASIGGMVATSASGTKAVRYGTMKENVLALRVVLPNGSVLKTANRARKSVSGYNLTQLFAASEGTLGIITEITLKVYHIPPHRIAALIPFNNIENATHCVFELVQKDIQLGMVELMDDLMMKAINLQNKLSYEEKPTLYLEYCGDTTQIELQQSLVESICKKFNSGQFRFATTKKRTRKIIFNS
jgi:D-lactate dehydrogenase (cytochrome)